MIELFFSYSHHDETMRNELEIHLTMLKRQGLVRAWHDRRIIAGKEFDREISDHLERADVILLLLSPHFLASDYCYETEAQRALQRHEEGTAIVIPVILQPCDWLESPFQKLRATPTDGKPIAKFPNVNDAFLEVTRDIRAAAASLHKEESAAPMKTLGAVHLDAGLRSSNLRLKKTFTDRDRDSFRDEVLSYIDKFFENSLVELRDRNPIIEFRFKRFSASGFTAAIYNGGSKKTGCHVWLAEGMSFGVDIAYSSNDSTATNSINDGFSVDSDGFQLGLKASGFGLTRSTGDALMTPHGASEYLWSLFIFQLQ